MNVSETNKRSLSFSLSLLTAFTTTSGRPKGAYTERRNVHFHEAKIKSSRTSRKQMLEAEVEAKDYSLRPRPKPRTKFWPRGLNITGHLQYTPQNVNVSIENVCVCKPVCWDCWRKGSRFEQQNNIIHTVDIAYMAYVNVNSYNRCIIFAEICSKLVLHLCKAHK